MVVAPGQSVLTNELAGMVGATVYMVERWRWHPHWLVKLWKDTADQEHATRTQAESKVGNRRYRRHR